MSVSSRIFWQLVDNDLLWEFANWLRKEYPILFIHLTQQFIHKKGVIPSARS